MTTRKVKITAKLPEGTANGLISLWAHLIHHPADAVVTVAIWDCKSLTTDIDDGEVTPTARMIVIEPIGGADAEQARKLLRAAYLKRTGEDTLPLELSEALDSVVDADRQTGELPQDPDPDR